MAPYPKKGRPKASRAARSRYAVNLEREPVYIRDGHQCVVAGSTFAAEWPCSGDLTIQHSIGKGAGGSALYDGPECLRTMCGWHNTLAEINSKFAKACLWFGWSIPRGWTTIDPEVVPVRYPDGADYLLTRDRNRTAVPAGWAYTQRIALYGAAANPTIEY